MQIEPSPPATRIRFAPAFTALRISSSSSAGSTSRISKRPEEASASRAFSELPDPGLRNAGMSERSVTPSPAAVLVRRPEPRQRCSVWRLAQLLERALANLPDALAGYAHQSADLLERHRIRALLET